ncbi:MAG: hypothetical protein WC928_03125 [Patescibacteria group bacterium]|jgi:hypothetical protein
MFNLLTFKYWFNPTPDSLIYSAKIILVLFLIFLFLAGVFFIFFKKKAGPYKVLANKLYEFSFVNLFIGFLLFFFNYQQIYFLSSRFWFLLWLILLVWWLLNIYTNFKKVIFRREERNKKEQFKKYLP